MLLEHEAIYIIVGMVTYTCLMPLAFGAGTFWLCALVMIAAGMISQVDEISEHIGVRRNAGLPSLSLRVFRAGEIIIMLAPLAIVITTAALHISNLFSLVFDIAEIITQGGRIILLSCASFFFMSRILIKLLNKIPLLGSSKEISIEQIFSTMFAFANFIIALLYYGIRFNSSGTVEPSWTNNLG
jgi:hypothetical protein